MVERKRLILVLFGALGLVVATSALAWACTGRANIRLDPANGDAGSSVTVHGNEFLRGEVDIYWDSVSASRYLGTAEATGGSRTAEFTKTVSVPENAGGGDHTVVARTSEPDSSGSSYQAQAVYTVDSPQESSADPSQEQESSGDPSPESSGSPSSQTSGSPSQESSESPSQESSGEPSQQTSGTTSQETSGSNSQETSGAASQDRSRDGTSEPNSVPAMGPGEEDNEEPGAPSQEGEPGAADQPDRQTVGGADSASGDGGGGDGERSQIGPGGGDTAASQPQNDPAGAENRQQVAPDVSEPAPSGESSATEADDAPASANQGTVETDSGEAVFGGSVGASGDTEQTQAPEPTDEGPEPVTAPSEEQSGGFSIPEAMRSAAADTAEDETLTPGSAGGDLWSGLESGETPSLTDEALADDESVSRTDGLPGALTAGVALLGLGLVTLVAGLGTAAVRRRQPAVARTRNRSQER